MGTKIGAIRPQQRTPQREAGRPHRELGEAGKDPPHLPWYRLQRELPTP